ncbi:hypothetical protein TB2_034044 [Malus domestica]
MVRVPKLWNCRSCQWTPRGTALLKPLPVLFPACRSLFIDSKPLMIPATKKKMKNFFFATATATPPHQPRLRSNTRLCLPTTKIARTLTETLCFGPMLMGNHQ